MMTPRRRLPPEVLTPEEIASLLAACGRATWTARRNRALIVLLYRSGLRLGEALALRPCDIDFARGAVRVLRAKGGQARTSGIDPGGAAAVRAWADERAEMGFGVGGALFCSASGKPVTQAYVRRRLPELARRAGIPKRVHAHGLRHTHAAELRAEGVDIAVIRRQLGHAHLMTTVVYLDHLAPNSVLTILSGRRPTR
ncbi:MAG: tyrosine-type recombinase/integrase [Phycisphaerales bacterium]